MDFDERHKSARSRVRDDKNDYARAKRSLPHLIVVVKCYSLRWFCCFFFFLPFLSGVKKKKETEDKIRKITYESAKRDDSIRNIGRG